MTPSESIFLSQICIELILGCWMSGIRFRIQILLLMKEYVSVYHLIIRNGLKDLTLMLLSIEMAVHFLFNE